MLSFSVVFICLQQQTETRIQMIKMVNEFKLTVVHFAVHFARPNQMQICACAWIYRWTEKPWKMRSGLPGLRASGPPGRRAVAGRGPLGLRAAGPLGRGGPWPAGRWAAGLLLAKPISARTSREFKSGRLMLFLQGTVIAIILPLWPQNPTE